MGNSNGLTRYFVDTIAMASSFKFGIEEGFYDFFGFLGCHKACRDANYIGIVMLACQGGYFAGPAKRSTDALMFVRRDGYTVGASAYQYTSAFYLAFHGFRNGMCKVRIVDRLAVVCTEIGDRISEFFDIVF